MPGVLRTAPSDVMKRGDFASFLRPDGTGAIHDPDAPGQYFPNNQIPVNRFDSVSAKLMQSIPSSTDPSYLLRFGTPSNVIDDKQFILGADHLISARQRLTGRYFYLHFDRPRKLIPGNLLYVNSGQFGSAHHATLAHTISISSRLLNEVSSTFHLTTPKSNPPSDLNVSYELLGARIKAIPGFETMDLSISNWSGVSLGLGYYGPQTTYVIGDTLGYANGKHNLRIDGEVKRYRLDIASYWMSGGTATFNGQLFSDPGKSDAGNSFAEFLLGKASQWRQQSFWSERLYTNFVALYFQDDIRLTSKLTANIGLRWDPKFDSTEKYEADDFHSRRQSAVYPNAPLGLLFQGDSGYENHIIPADNNNLAPRIGLAYQFLVKDGGTCGLRNFLRPVHVHL
jgi:hypothetical protein